MGRRIKELLAKDQVVRTFCVGQLCSPKIVEMVGRCGGFDAVWLDQEHAGLSIGQIELACLAARAVGLDSFVRLAPTDYATVMRPMEAGAGGIMAAQVRSAAQTRDIVRWAKFHPEGLRGVNGGGVDGGYGAYPVGDYFRRANEDTLVVIQIEHVDAIDDVERIAAVPGVDVLFVGPSDLAQSMGLVGEPDHPQLWQAIERVAAAARQHGIHWAILPRDPAQSRRCVELGCRLLSIGVDVWVVQRGLRSFASEYQ